MPPQVNIQKEIYEGRIKAQEDTDRCRHLGTRPDGPMLPLCGGRRSRMGGGWHEMLGMWLG